MKCFKAFPALEKIAPAVLAMSCSDGPRVSVLRSLGIWEKAA